MATYIRSVDGKVQVEIEPGSPATLLPNIGTQGIQKEIDDLEQAITTYRGQPVVVTDAADMEDELTIYLYMGSESGYNANHWYYYDGTEWVDGGEYVANPVLIDDTLTQSGEAADAKVTGDEISALKADLTNNTDYIREGATRVFPKWEVGAINNSGQDEASTSMVRCDAILLSVGDKFNSTNTSLRVFYYELDGTFISTLYSVTANTDYVMEKPVLVRFRISYNSSLDIDWYDQNLTITKYDASVSHTERIKKMEDAFAESVASTYKPTLFFSLGGLNTTTGTEMPNNARARSLLFYVPKAMYVRSTNDSYQFRLLKYDMFGNFIQTINNSNVSSQAISEGYYRVLIFPTDGTITDLTSYLTDIEASIWCREQKHLYYVSKDGNGDFDDVQTALDFATHASASYPVTIFIEVGVYDKISTITQKKYIDDIPNDGIKYYNRYISLIGRNEKTCIIKSDAGEYYVPAAEINVSGLIKNLTFISTHDSPPDNMTDDSRYQAHKAYAVHSDYGTEDSIYENCTMISYQAPAMGIGGANNKHIRLRDCHFYSYAPSTGDYSPLVNYGGLFYHLYAIDGAVGQLFEMENCYVYSENGDKAVWITPSSATNYEQETKLLRNCFYGKSCGTTVSIDGSMVSADSYGNNVDEANYIGL